MGFLYESYKDLKDFADEANDHNLLYCRNCGIIFTYQGPPVLDFFILPDCCDYTNVTWLSTISDVTELCRLYASGIRQNL